MTSADLNAALNAIVDRAIPLVKRRIVDCDTRGQPIYADEVFYTSAAPVSLGGAPIPAALPAA